MWWTSSGTHHPHQEAPLCAPCNYAKNTSGMPFPYPNGCPCTPEVLCGADTKGVLMVEGPQNCRSMHMIFFTLHDYDRQSHTEMQRSGV